MNRKACAATGKTERRKKMAEAVIIVVVSDRIKEKVGKQWTVNWDITRQKKKYECLDDVHRAANEALMQRLRQCIVGKLPRTLHVVRVWTKVPAAVLAANPDYPKVLDVVEDDDLKEVASLAAAKGSKGSPVLHAEIDYLPKKTQELKCSLKALQEKVKTLGFVGLFLVKKANLEQKKNLLYFLNLNSGKKDVAEVTTVKCVACTEVVHQVDELDSSHRLDTLPLVKHAATCSKVDDHIKTRKNAGTLKAGIENARKTIASYRTTANVNNKKRRKEQAEKEQQETSHITDTADYTAEGAPGFDEPGPGFDEPNSHVEPGCDEPSSHDAGPGLKDPSLDVGPGLDKPSLGLDEPGSGKRKRGVNDDDRKADVYVFTGF